MLAAVKRRSRRLAERLGWCHPPLSFTEPLPFCCERMARVQRSIDRRVRPYTMTGPERVAALCQALAHLERRRIAGAIVECGVWRGGSMMAAALTLLHLGCTHRQLYLCDTFAGMPAPADVDRDWRGRSAAALLQQQSSERDIIAACCALEEVRAALWQTGYPRDRMVFVPGRVEETLPHQAPGAIALLRLDTDWYASTYHELRTLYPRLTPGGVLIVDDYGHWQGARRAVDDYFKERGEPVRLYAIDYTARLIVKGGDAA
jgi:O-methyltransferase